MREVEVPNYWYPGTGETLVASPSAMSGEGGEELEIKEMGAKQQEKKEGHRFTSSSSSGCRKKHDGKNFLSREAIPFMQERRKSMGKKNKESSRVDRKDKIRASF